MKKDLKKKLENIKIYNTLLDNINNDIFEFNNSLELISEINKTIIFNKQTGGSLQQQVTVNNTLNTKLDSLNTLIKGMITKSDSIKTLSDANNTSQVNLGIKIEQVSTEIGKVHSELETIQQNNNVYITTINKTNDDLDKLRKLFIK